jgi:pyruvate formate lyase activating enzyme
MFDERLCRRFEDCIKAGDGKIISRNNTLFIDRENILNASFLKDICPSGALSVTGKEVSVQEILREVEKDIPFYRMSNGGVTFSGGEPFSQESDLKELMVELRKKGIHISVETSLHVPWETIEEYDRLVDTFLADLKHTDAEKFGMFTGGNATLVLNNFTKLDEKGSHFIIRVPVIPGFNYSEKELYSIIDFAAGLKNAREINFIPFHSLAKEKYAMLGREYQYGDTGDVDKTDLLKYVEFADRKGLKAEILN